MHGVRASAFVRILFLLLSFSCTAYAATEINKDYVGALWVAKSDGVLKLATADGQVLFEINDASEAQAMAIDEKNGRVWLYGGSVLSAYSFDGTLITRSRNGQSRGQAASVLAISPVDGSVWLGSGNELVHFSATAEVLASTKLSGVVTALAADNESPAVWVADTQSVSLITASASRLALTGLYKSSAAIQGLHYDQALKQLWVVTGTGLVRLDGTGVVVSDTPFKQLKQIAPDHRGGLWAVTSQKVYRMDASGLIEAELNLFLPRDGGDVVAVVADKADGSVWLANRKKIVHLGVAGEYLHEINDNGAAGFNALALFRDLIAPLLSTLNPADDSIINNNSPIIEIGYSDTGIGVDGNTLQLFVNSMETAVQCETAQDGAKCRLSTPLQEGDQVLAAEVKDYAGNVSAK